MALHYSDPELDRNLKDHDAFRRGCIDMIAGATIPTAATKEAMLRVELTRGVEGSVRNRFINNGSPIDAIESLAINRVKRTFGVEHANVQIASGTQANNAVLQGTCKLGATILAMDLLHGGHLSHGHPKSQAGRCYNVETYGVEEASQTIDYDALRKLAFRLRPRLIIAGASSYPRNLSYDVLASIASEVEAVLLLDISHPAGFIACGLLKLPTRRNIIITSTTYKTLCGPRGALIGCSLDVMPSVEKGVFPGMQSSVSVASIAGKAAVLGDASRLEYEQFQKQVLRNAQLMVEAFQKEDIEMVTGGTDGHMIVIDLKRFQRSGRQVEEGLLKMHVIANRQMIPYDPLFPKDVSGVRFGTATVTIQQIQPDELSQLCTVIAELIHCGQTKERSRKFVCALAADLNRRSMHPIFEPSENRGTSA